MIPSNESEASGRERWESLRVVIIVAAPFVLAFLVYRDLLGLWFWTDDFVWLEAASNPDLTDSFREAWRLPQGATPYWRPLVDFHFFSMYRIFGLSGAPYHVVNVALHAATAGMLGILVVRVTKSWAMAGLGAALFAVSPTYATMVPWASGATAIYASLFSVLTVLLFMSWLQAGRGTALLAVATVAYTLALLSKEEPAVLPGVLLVFALALKPPRNWRDARALAGALVPFIGLSLAYGVLQAVLEFGPDQSPGYSIGWHALKRLIDSMVWLSLPLHLSYAEWVSPARWAAFATFTFIAAISAARRQWLLPSLYIATLLMLVPASFFTARFAGRWTHLATLPWAVFIAALFVYASDALSRMSRPLGLACGVAAAAWLLMFLSGRTLAAHAVIPGFSRDYQAIERALTSGCAELTAVDTVYIVQLPLRGPSYSVPALIRLYGSPGLLYLLEPSDLVEASLPETGGCSLYWTEADGYQAAPGPPPVDQLIP